MPTFLWRWLVTSITILMLPSLLSGVHVEGLGSAIAAAALIGVLNVLVKPILILLTLPLTLITLGFFLLVINAIVFQMAGALVGGITVESFGYAFLAALIVSLVSWITNLSFRREESGRRVVYVRHERPAGRERTVN